jgi:hypothetical protein
LVTVDTCATPWLSRSSTPIWEGVIPFFASLEMMSVTSWLVILSQLGDERLYGSALLLIPLPVLCMRPMFAEVCTAAGGPETGGAALGKGESGARSTVFYAFQFLGFAARLGAISIFRVTL